MVSQEILSLIERAIAEDVGPRDVTTESIVPLQATLKGQIIAKQAGVVAGLDVAEAVFHRLDERVLFQACVREGELVAPRQVLANIKGPARAILSGERTALNFLGRMSGIATLTHQFVEAAAGTRAAVLDTRKTAPGLRTIDKLAVHRGGGRNHRQGLFDMILIKDNHIDFATGLTEAVQRSRAAAPGIPMEVEARTLNEVREALDLGVTRILLDNMTPDMLRASVAMNHGRARLEASGNVSLENVREVAETGVDDISVGALTHSPRVFDVSLELVRL
ncbi:MAG: carboxylating nicotinate-nucleotide diphosphorylase [Anaerolineales bacterium]|jgi:nicotinate-nucleotide pyrophosphorylase (carboxylating)